MAKMDAEKESRILRKSLKFVLAKEEARIVKANEFHRKMTQLAQAIGEGVEDVEVIFAPMFRELVEEMVAPLPVAPRKSGVIGGKGIPGSAFDHQ